MTDFTQLDLEHKRELLTSFRMLNIVTDALIQHTGIDKDDLFKQAFGVRLHTHSLSVNEINRIVSEIEELFQQQQEMQK